MKRSGRPLCLALALAASLCFGQNPQEKQTWPIDRTQLPEAVQQVALEHLSSGALMLLDRGGNLVRSRASLGPLPQITARPLTAATLDPSVGTNIRLGDDPSSLPPGMRAQAEPHIARSSIDPNFLVAVFQEGRFTDAGAVDCGFSISSDGGMNWSRALIPNLTLASGGSYYRATDPVAGIGPNGDVYLNTEGATDPNFNNGDILVSRSTDGGQTFGAPSIVYQPPTNSLLPDKPWMAVNTFSATPTAGRILATFTLFSNSSTTGGAIERAYSDDHGSTWSAVASVNSGVLSAQGSQPLFLPNGNAVVVYWNFGTSAHPGERLEALISTDGGATFGAPKLITFASEYNEPVIRTGAFLPSAVGDRINNNVYVVFQTRLAGNPKIAFTKSIDGGNHWSVPVAISDNPSGDGVFNPALNVSPDGQTLTASFYDHRDNPNSNLLVDLYLAKSFDGGATWQPNIRVTSTSTDASLAPLTNQGYMLGDYLGIAESTNPSVPAIPVWIDTRTGNPDPFVARVTISPTPAPSATPTPTPSPTPVPRPTITISAAPATIVEGNDATYTISASTINPTQVTTVHYMMSGRSQPGIDYTLSGTFGAADIPAGASSTTVTLHSLTDTVHERNEKAIMTLTAGPNYTLTRVKKAAVIIFNQGSTTRRSDLAEKRPQ